MGIDLAALHAFLWRNTDRTGRLLLTQTKVGELFDLYPMAASRVFKALESDGRVRRLGIKVFVVDPDTWGSDGNTDHSVS